MTCDFVNHYEKLMQDLIYQTQVDGHEHGFTAIKKDGQWEIVEKCEGDECEIALAHKRDIEDTEWQPTHSFHTHPSAIEALPSARDIVIGQLFNEVEMCLGTDVEVKCWPFETADSYKLSRLWRLEEMISGPHSDSDNRWSDAVMDPYWDHSIKPSCHRTLLVTPQDAVDLTMKHYDTTRYLYSDIFRKARKFK
jgi:hypothetical protein